MEAIIQTTHALGQEKVEETINVMDASEVVKQTKEHVENLNKQTEAMNAQREKLKADVVAMRQKEKMDKQLAEAKFEAAQQQAKIRDEILMLKAELAEGKRDQQRAREQEVILSIRRKFDDYNGSVTDYWKFLTKEKSMPSKHQ